MYFLDLKEFDDSIAYGDTIRLTYDTIVNENATSGNIIMAFILMISAVIMPVSTAYAEGAYSLTMSFVAGEHAVSGANFKVYDAFDSSG